MNKFLQSCAVAAVLSTMTVSAHAAYYTYSIDNPPQQPAHSGGEIHNITTSYSTTTETFSWDYTIDDINDGFWLVVSDGPNPKSASMNEYAIFYGDLNNNTLSAYQYNGANNSVSWNSPGNLLDQWSGALTTTDNGNGTETTSFSVDVSGINSQNLGAEWDGAQFGEKIGIWFHPSKGSNFSYNGNGEITGYTHGGAGWHDSSNRTTTEEPLDPTEIPAPSALFLLGLGLLGMTYARRNKAA